MKYTFTLSFILFTFLSLFGQTSGVQFIHNSAGAPAVDLWVDGVKVIDNIAYRSASSFTDVTSGADLSVGIAPSPSTDPSEIIFSTTLTLMDASEYVLMAQGVSGNMDRPLNINQYVAQSSTSSNGVDVKLIHGAMDVDAVDVGIRGVANRIALDLAYAEETPYLPLPANNYFFDVYPAGGATPVATYNGDLSMNASSTAVIFVSGYLDPMAGPAIGMFVALADGTVVEFPSAELGTLQLINNSVGTVLDIYIGGQLVLNDFAFQAASNTIAVNAGEDFDIAIAPGTSTSINDAFISETFVFENFKNNKLFMEGIQGDMNTPFVLVNADGATLSADADKVDLYFHHGVTDAPALDAGIRGGSLLTSNISYGESALISTDPVNFLLELIPTGTTDVFSTHNAPLTGTDGASYVVYASGLVNSTDPANEFNLVIVLSNGQSFYLEQVKFSNVQILHNSPAEMVDVYLGDLKLIDAFDFRTATPALELISDTEYTISIAPVGTTIDDAIFETTFTPAEDGNYLIMAEGVVGSPSTPFNVRVIPNYRFLSNDDTKVDILGIHGSPDAPEVDILANGNSFIEDIDYGDITNYLTVDPAEYTLSVTDADDNSAVIARYSADLSMAAGVAVTVYASGLVNADPAFHLWALLGNGVTFPLPLVTSNVERLAEGLELRVGPNPASEFGMVHFTKEFEVESIDLISLTGQLVKHYDQDQMVGSSGAYKFDLYNVASGNYVVKINTSDKSYTSKLSVVR